MTGYTEWKRISETLPDLVTEMETVARRQATETEPCELLRRAIECADLGAWDGAERARALAQRWAEGNPDMTQLAENLRRLIIARQNIEQAREQGDFAQALVKLVAWEKLPERQTILTMVKALPMASAEKVAPIASAWQPDAAPAEAICNWLDERQLSGARRALQDALLGRLDVAMAIGQGEALQKICQQLQDCRSVWAGNASLDIVSELQRRHEDARRKAQFFQEAAKRISTGSAENEKLASPWWERAAIHDRAVAALATLLPVEATPAPADAVPLGEAVSETAPASQRLGDSGAPNSFGPAPITDAAVTSAAPDGREHSER